MDTYLNVVRNDDDGMDDSLWGRRRLAYEINKKPEGVYAVDGDKAGSDSQAQEEGLPVLQGQGVYVDYKGANLPRKFYPDRGKITPILSIEGVQDPRESLWKFARILWKPWGLRMSVAPAPQSLRELPERRSRLATGRKLMPATYGLWIAWGQPRTSRCFALRLSVQIQTVRGFTTAK